jgi:hypothetical protein
MKYVLNQEEYNDLQRAAECAQDKSKVDKEAFMKQVITRLGEEIQKEARRSSFDDLGNASLNIHTLRRIIDNLRTELTK